MRSPIDKQIEELTVKFPTANVTKLPDGMYFVRIDSFKLGDGWDRESTKLSFYLPVGFPVACPCNFYTDVDLNFKSGATPRNSSTDIDPFNNPVRRFSFRVNNWNGNICSILTYVRTILNSLIDASIRQIGGAE